MAEMGYPATYVDARRPTPYHRGRDGRWLAVQRNPEEERSGTVVAVASRREYHRKWDVKSEQGIFLEYSQNSRAYRVFNNRSETVMKTINVMVNDLEPTAKWTIDEDDEVLNVPVVSSTVLTETPKADT
ncbi:gag-pol polyprotein [Cucumis melo var. makuwa]|uniref:Gag-pol polyprotein n=1 Tax=Cucumis melo var. makuwa TaxID=1194695 RepID=A0A5A7TTV9_CUCMM|nr:gag-pol polyprotein [Cucumis melo var. makuwa]